jgi:serine/threonine-protein kinase
MQGRRKEALTMLQIPGFEMQSKLGAGGMAEVWKARQVSLDRTVAVKILSAQFSQESADVKRFQQEAQAAAKLKHSGIVQVYDANAIGGTYYFVMEYVAGYTAGEWLRRKGVIPEKDALLVVECVADALAYAWDTARVVHCDIKPDNIMVDADGSVKVTDLGLARTISAMSARGLTEEVLGTPAYMAPEQARGENDLDFRADIYSLGATLYHMLTGKLLFQGNPDEQVMEMQVSDTVPDPIDVNPALSKAVSWLLEKMLAKDRGDRYENWQALRADVARVRSGMMPLGRLGPKSASTVTRSSKRTVATVPRAKKPNPIAAAAQQTDRAVPLWVFLLVVGIAALLVAGLFKILEGQMYGPGQYASGVVHPPVQPPVHPPVQPVQPNETSAVGEQCRAMFETARQWVLDNPGQYDDAIARFRMVMKKAVGTPYEVMAAKAIRDLANERALELERTADQIRKRAEMVEKESGPAAAAAYLEDYAGPFKADTQRMRAEEARVCRARHNAAAIAKAEKTKREEGRYTSALDGIVCSIMDPGVESGRGIAMNAMNDPALAGRTHVFAAIKKVFDDAADMDNRIMNSFAAQKGETVTVMLNNNTTKTIVVDAVADGLVTGTLRMGTAAFVTVRFGLKDLAVRERLQRMGSDTDPAVGLVKGQMALAAKAYDKAAKYFDVLPQEIRDRLMVRIARIEGSAAVSGAGDVDAGSTGETNAAGSPSTKSVMR